ncbi:MAG: DUF4229 domain-containing protein [Dermatophilaceae bacterium]
MPVARFTLLRLGVFLACLGLLWLLGLRSVDQQIWLVLGAGALSMLVSFFLLKRQRAAVSERIADRVTRVAEHRAEQRAAAVPSEDELAEDREADGR